MAAIKQIKVDGVIYDIKAKLDIDGNDITTTYVKKDGEKVLSTEDFTTELKNKLDGVANNANNYVHPSNSGNKHIPSGGSSGKILVWKSDGEALWGDDKDTTPAKATTDADGLMSKEDKAKLDGVAANANNYSHPTGAGNNHIPAGGSSGLILKWSAAGTATWGAEKSYSNATSSAAGLMSAADKAKLDAIEAQANKYELPAAGTSIGGVKQGVAVEDVSTELEVTADNVALKLNLLLASLRNAGIIATE